MQAFRFPGTYEDQRGIEALEWQIVPSQLGSIRGYQIHTSIRGVAVWGYEFDALSPDEPLSEDPRPLHLNSNGDVFECVLTGTPPVPVELDGHRRESAITFSLDLRPSPERPPTDPKNLHLSIVLDGARYEVTDDWFEDVLLRLQAAMPSNARLVACITCLFSDYSPVGHGLMGMTCHRDAKSQYLAVRTKFEYFKVPVTEEVPEIYLCPEYERRVPGTGYRG